MLAGLLAGCSGSSSTGGSAAPGDSGTTGVIGSSTHAATSTGPQTGPNGSITAPVSNPPSKGSTGGSEIFPKISKGRYEHLVPKLDKQAGVRSTAYYPQSRELQVYFKPNTSSSQRQAVIRTVTGS